MRDRETERQRESKQVLVMKIHLIPSFLLFAYHPYFDTFLIEWVNCFICNIKFHLVTCKGKVLRVTLVQFGILA